ncbi:MAG TPA: hypothetical protein VNC22_08390 [Sporichthya sp.]|jgi:hypothetical protein|nr:hypothetical protein [Sporichthya sp.]
MAAFREAFGDLFEMEADLVCVLVNLVVRANGKNVMGAGQANRAAKLFPGLERAVGQAFLERGKAFVDLGRWRRFDLGTEQRLAAFPTKRHWIEPGSTELIELSARQLMAFLDSEAGRDVATVLLPRPGCGLGSLDWAGTVRPLLEPILDERVIVTAHETERPA